MRGAGRTALGSSQHWHARLRFLVFDALELQHARLLFFVFAALDTAWKIQKVMCHSQLKRPMISTLFQRPSEVDGLANAISGSLQAPAKI